MVVVVVIWSLLCWLGVREWVGLVFLFLRVEGVGGWFVCWLKFRDEWLLGLYFRYEFLVSGLKFRVCFFFGLEFLRCIE